MRSTGICVNPGNGECIYYLIVSTCTKKVRGFSHPRFNLMEYTPVPTKGQPGILKESAKTQNVISVAEAVGQILDNYSPDQVKIESVALHGSGLIDELAGLNYVIRTECIKRGIPVYAITPSSNKLVFSGCGSATKDIMVSGWEACEPEAEVFLKFLGKHVEDLADAYALCHFPI